MAPELIQGKQYDAKIDIWSLGVLIFEMAQNNPPYIEHPPLKALYLIVSNGLPSLQDPDRFSEQFKDFLKLCTTMNPILRPDAESLLKVSYTFLYYIIRLMYCVAPVHYIFGRYNRRCNLFN
jgi:p21-activated kinase 1